MSLKRKLEKFTSRVYDTKFIPAHPLIDQALGGGFPRRRLVELFGPPGGGKTSLALLAVASIQGEGMDAVYVDAEHCFDPAYARFRGVDLDKLLLCQPDSAEEVIEIVLTSCNHGAGLVVVDSVGGLVTRAELDGEEALAPVARLLANKLRSIVQAAKLGDTCVLFINQTRKQVNTMIPGSEHTCGGEALKFFASVRVEIRRVASIKHAERVIGFKSKVKTVKNKLAPPFREGFFSLTFDPEAPDLALIENMLATGEVKASAGGYLEYGGKRVQGKERLLEVIRHGTAS